jgi:hypothetical protein
MNRREFLGGSGAVMASPFLISTVGCPAKNWMDNAEADAHTATAILLSVLGVVAVAQANGQLSPSNADKIRRAAQIAQTTLNELAQAINAYKTSPSDTGLAKISDTLSQLATQLPTILDGLTISDTNTRTAITAGLTLAISIVAALQVIVPSVQATGLQAHTRTAAKPALKSGDVELPTPTAVISMYNSVLAQNGFSDQQIK